MGVGGTRDITRCWTWTTEARRLKKCPDEEGIETSELLEKGTSYQGLKKCPDEEGIETAKPYARSCVTNLSV